MPLDYRIDHQLRLVVATASGTLTDQEVFGYQREVWSRPELAGYDELVDMSAVESIALPSPKRVEDLVALSTKMDAAGGDSSRVPKFAIFAPTDISYGLGRMYQTLREMQSGGARKVGVFRSMEEALSFLEVEAEVLGLARNRDLR